MAYKLDVRIGELLKLLADPTRRKIIDLLIQEPINPQDIANALNISRPAVEKHLKLLSAQYICERTVEPFPAPHYVYYMSGPSLDLHEAIISAMILYFQSMDGIVNAEIEQIERKFILKKISRKEYESRLSSLKIKQKDLADLQLTRIWVEEAKRMIAEHNDNDTSSDVENLD
ncbi:MAG: ArsR family transcriptional regulator [Candidatus Heimdallarchaeota archaeon]|nr:ArsR family transcriptional regulator [Candidatus Heimdallarchaeota archaeon]